MTPLFLAFWWPEGGVSRHLNSRLNSGSSILWLLLKLKTGLTGHNCVMDPICFGDGLSQVPQTLLDIVVLDLFKGTIINILTPRFLIHHSCDVVLSVMPRRDHRERWLLYQAHLLGDGRRNGQLVRLGSR